MPATHSKMDTNRCFSIATFSKSSSEIRQENKTFLREEQERFKRLPFSRNLPFLTSFGLSDVPSGEDLNYLTKEEELIG